MIAKLTMLLASVVLATIRAPGESDRFIYPYEPYNQTRMDPQLLGWPLNPNEREFVLKPEHLRRPGAESAKHLPPMWPVTPSAGYWGGTSWLDAHAKLVEATRAHSGAIDILLVGDSITQQWGSALDTGKMNAAWQSAFGRYKTVNIGIGGDKIQNVLWRLDHGGADGLDPKIIVLMIGNNNMFFVAETGVEAVAQGIKVTVGRLRHKFPKAKIVVCKILLAHEPANPFYHNIVKTNEAIGALNLDSNPTVKVLDINGDLKGADGALKAELYLPDKIHLSQQAGYSLFARRLAPVIETLLGERKGRALSASSN